MEQKTDIAQITVNSKEEAEIALRKIRTQLTPTVSKYSLSGKVSGAGFLAIVAAVIPASIVGGVLGIIGSIIGEQIVRVLGSISEQICGSVILSIPLLLIAVALPSAGIGIASAYIIAYVAKRTKIRNFNMVVGFSILSSIVGIGILLAVWVGPRSVIIFDELDYPRRTLTLSGIPLDPNVIGLIMLLVMLVITLWLAFATVREALADLKFCESCNQVMAKHNLNASDWETAEKLNALINPKRTLQSTKALDIHAVADLIREGSGTDVENTLHVCDNCKKGYLESTAHFSATWTGGALKTDWLFCSIETTSEESPVLLEVQQPPA